jgi:hypothetical protein
MSLTLPIIKNITQYLPLATRRSLNKQFLSEHSSDYCQLASYIYNDDMYFIYNNFINKAVFYYNNDTLHCKLHYNTTYRYKIKHVDNTYVLSVKNKINDINNIVNVDLSSQYKILKNRGCEDKIKNFSKTNTLKILANFFNNYFNPDRIQDLLYLYVFLHTSCVLLNYVFIDLNQRIFKINKLPPDDFLKEIYDLYNLLYVHFDVLED